MLVMFFNFNFLIIYKLLFKKTFNIYRNLYNNLIINIIIRGVYLVKYCPKCGNELDDDAEYCMNCQHNVSNNFFKKNKKIIAIVIVIIIVLVAIFSVMYFTDNSKKAVVYVNTIEGVGTFNSTNVTNFTLSRTTDTQTDYVGNDSISQVTVSYRAIDISVTISKADKVNDSAKGHSIYKNTANIGDHKGEIRYFAILEDQDNNRAIMISTADYNLTCMIVDTFKFLEPK